MSEKKSFDLGRLRDQVAGQVTVQVTVDGAKKDVQHDVLQIKAWMYQSLKTAKPSEAVARLIEATAGCVPTLTPEQLGELNVEQMNVIVGIAGAGVDAIEALYAPNAASPATSTSPG